MIPLDSLLFGGQSAGLQDNYISFGGGRSKKQIQQMKGKKVEPHLTFCCALAEKMLINNLDDDGKRVVQVGQPVS